MSALYAITVSGVDKGEVFKNSGRWRWQCTPRGTETYSRKATLLSVREHVARLCRVNVSAVKLTRKPWSGANP